MTLEKDEQRLALWFIKNQSNLLRYYEVADFLKRNLIINPHEIFEQLLALGCLETIDDGTILERDSLDSPWPNPLIKITPSGFKYLVILSDEKEKEILDFTLKKDALTSKTFQRNIAYITSLVALVVGIIPLIIYFMDRNKVQRISIPEAKEILQTQRDLQQSVQEIQKTYQNKDTAILRIRLEK